MPGINRLKVRKKCGIKLNPDYPLFKNDDEDLEQEYDQYLISAEDEQPREDDPEKKSDKKHEAFNR